MELISWGLHSSLERETKFRRRLSTSSIKREIRHFHVVVACSNSKEMFKKASCRWKLYCFFDVLVAVAVVFAKTPWCISRSLIRYTVSVYGYG